MLGEKLPLWVSAYRESAAKASEAARLSFAATRRAFAHRSSDPELEADWPGTAAIRRAAVNNMLSLLAVKEQPATPNATTEGSDDTAGKGATGPKPGPTGPDQDLSAEYPRETTIDGKKIKIIDTSGIAAAEAAGTTGTDGKPNATEHPGSG